MKNFKRAFSLVLALLVFAALPVLVGATQTNTSPALVIAGDMNGDSQLNATDLELLQKAVLGAPVPVEYDKNSADMNGDGKINIKDLATLIKELSKPTQEPEEDSGDDYFPGNW